jgi:hypothetical protein
MPRRILYRKQLLKAVEAFLEGTPSSLVQAHRIIHRCYVDIKREAKRATLDDIVWHFFVVALTDSVFYENIKYLQETRQQLLGDSSSTISRMAIFGNDYRCDFTAEEAEWYAQLMSMVNFLMAIPFAQLHAATAQARRDKETWTRMCANIPEAARAEQIDQEYEQRKTLIEDISAKSPCPENVGDEKIYHLVLREVTAFLTTIRAGRAAAYFGYPALHADYTDYRSSRPSSHDPVDATENLTWAKKSLDAIAGKESLFISWRLSKGATFGSDVLLVSMH